MSDFKRQIGGQALPSHSWMAPLVKYMLQEARARLTEAVVTGPGRAILSMGDV